MADERSPLESEIRRLIGAAGPMPLSEYMRLCLTHPQHGYYINRDPFGAGGDFITSPEISQMFGELIGLWMAAVWRQMGEPENVRVIELGPGRGTLMHDALRAAKVVKGFREAIVLHLVEISPALQKVQDDRLADLGIPILWHTALAEVPGGPSIIIANEFIDALPVHQAAKQDDGWHERVVDIAGEGNLVFAAAPDPLPFFEASMPRGLRQAPLGAIYEWRADNIALELGRRLRNEGAALIIDYGHTHFGLGDTLQAVAGHSFTDPLRAPGQADLTAHVDFEALAQCAESMGARMHGPIRQRDLFLRLGIEQRAAALKASAPRQQAADIELAFSRLIGGRRPRHGRIVQGDRDRGAAARRASRIRDTIMMIEAASLKLTGIRHAFFTRDGGVSGGLYASLNGGIGSRDDAGKVAENRARMAAALGVEPHRFLTAYQIHSPQRRRRRSAVDAAMSGRAPTPSSPACARSPSASPRPIAGRCFWPTRRPA